MSESPARQHNPDGDPYERTGIAWAWALTKDAEWETPRGDQLTGKAGDWWVVAEDGSSRTVAADVFGAAYAQIERQVYRRIGTIRARQAQGRERVESLEGAAHAEPGDWIATDPSGNRWPIPAEVFAELYRPVEGGVDSGTTGGGR